jgi:beta-phosphoglucomutase family hydrolase
MNFKGMILDMDGVITKTARIHSKAWKEMFDKFLKTWSKKKKIEFVPFNVKSDYHSFVDGKPRLKGIESFLKSRNIRLPMGKETDDIKDETIIGLGNNKNKMFQKIIKSGDFEVFESTVKLINNLKSKGIKIAIATSSKNGKLVLKSAKLLNLSKILVDGVVSLKLNLKGKPDPDIFITAAKKLKLKPSECVMVEDAISGVQAGRNGNFGLVLGVSRGTSKEALLANGADIVVGDLSEIRLDDLNNWFSKGLEKDKWSLNYYGLDISKESLRETLSTVGNGYFASRGNLEFKKADEIFYPGTYVAGLYNKIATKVHGHNVYNNDFVNVPNWTYIKFSIDGSEEIDPSEENILNYKQDLNIKIGLLTREIVFQDKMHRITKIKTEKFISMKKAHLGLIKFSLTPINYSGKITIISTIDGNIINYGVARYRSLNSKHLDYISSNHNKKLFSLHTRTNSSKVDIFISAKNEFKNFKIKKEIFKNKAEIGDKFSFNVSKNKTYILEKTASFFTSNDLDTKKPKKQFIKNLKIAKTFDKELEASTKEWKKLWQKMDIKISGDRFAQKVIRLHMYHLIVSASPKNITIDAGMTARGLHGEAYRGHVFWDELYVFPFYNLNFPDITRSLLKYRYKRLPAAKQYARKHNYKGAMYPWQTADDGHEETQTLHYNPMSGKWDPDLSCRQRHVSIAIFYNIYEYIKHTEDYRFLENYGAEMMIEIARFWSSISYFDKKTKKYHIKGVMGPDEYHEKLPGSKEHGLKDNAYTNVMVAWLLEKTLSILEKIPEKLTKDLKIKETEIKLWKDIIKNMNVIVNKNGIISQFDGYMKLKDLDFEKYKKKYGNIRRMDRILKSEGDTPDKYKVAKQADVMMLFYLLREHELNKIFKYLKINISKTALKDNYTYYLPRTSHGSTLSMVVHAAISTNIETKENVWKWFNEALISDIYDTQGGTTCEGIHAGVMAGTIDIIYKNFAGLEFKENAIQISPKLPRHWNSIDFSFLYKNNTFNAFISKDSIKISMKGKSKTFKLKINKKNYTLKKNNVIHIKY